VDFHLR